MSGWMFPHCCLLNEDRWGPLGCDIPKYDKGVARLEAATPWFYVSVALAPSGRFGKYRGFKPGMSRDEIMELPIDYQWVFWKWKKSR